jgi:hypothetical protein
VKDPPAKLLGCACSSICSYFIKVAESISS